jgi:hypothetical protein
VFELLSLPEELCPVSEGHRIVAKKRALKKLLTLRNIFLPVLGEILDNPGPREDTVLSLTSKIKQTMALRIRTPYLR